MLRDNGGAGGGGGGSGVGVMESGTTTIPTATTTCNAYSYYLLHLIPPLPLFRPLLSPTPPDTVPLPST